MQTKRHRTLAIEKSKDKGKKNAGKEKKILRVGAMIQDPSEGSNQHQVTKTQRNFYNPKRLERLVKSTLEGIQGPHTSLKQINGVSCYMTFKPGNGENLS